MSRLLLISNSTQSGQAYLEHCRAEVADFFAPVDGPILFVPYALADLDGYAATARKGFAAFGRELRSVHEFDDPAAAARDAAGFFTGGGNTFRLLKQVRALGLLDAIRARVAGGAPYMGTSAGSNLACPTVRTTNDMPIVEPGGFDALDLVPFQINPHYLDPDPSSTHMGETREQRIREFHEENHTPVLGIREGGMVRVEGGAARLCGPPAARLFERGRAARELPAGSDVSFLLG